MPGYAVVTGADHGLGRELTLQLAQRGYRVLAGRFDMNEVNGVSQESIHFFPLDLSDQRSIETFANAVTGITDKLDLIINNAGILGDMRLTIADKLDREDIRRVIDVNAIGTLMLTNALYGLISKGKDKLIINISSEAGSVSGCYRVGWFGYCMSKAANNMQGALIHNLFKQIGGRVIQMHPGHVRSFMRGHLDETGKLTPEESATAILKTILDKDLPAEDRPLYIDYEGKRLNY